MRKSALGGSNFLDLRSNFACEELKSFENICNEEPSKILNSKILKKKVQVFISEEKKVKPEID